HLPVSAASGARIDRPLERNRNPERHPGVCIGPPRPQSVARRGLASARSTEGGMRKQKAREGKARDERKQRPEGANITEREVEDVEERSSPRAPVIYEIVSKLGEEEMARPVTSLWWSGVAAGLSISFGLLAQAILQTHLPDAPWRLLITSFGYSVGFLMVVMARQQLFTGNTITVVLPVMADLTPRNVALLGRTWAIVLVANLAGTLFAALFCTFTPVLTPELRDGMMEISRQLLGHGWLDMVFKGISAG